MTEDEMIGWHHQLNGHEFEQAPEDGERHKSLACCSPWGHKEFDITEQLNNKRGRHKAKDTDSYLKVFCVGPGKSNLPFELRRKAGDCSRVTAGPIDLI